MAGKLIVLAGCILAGFAATPPARAEIDSALTASVWQMKFGLTAAQVNDPAWLAQDSDGDGLTNGAELIAGTDPLAANSGLANKNTSAAGGAFSVSVPTVAGKLYHLEWSREANGAGGWMALAPPVQTLGNGSVQTLAAPQAADAFYRVVVEEIDSDADGVSDWAEIVTGFDPHNTHTDGATTDDHTALTGQLANENVVTLVATDPSVQQPPDAATPPASNGSITLRRGGTLHFSTVTVALTHSGTADGGDGLPAAAGLGDFRAQGQLDQSPGDPAG